MPPTPTTEGSTKKALVAWGGWEGHTPLASAERVAALLDEAGIGADIRPGTEPFADPDLARYDLIVPIITMASIDQDELANLLAAVESGVGLAGFHGGMCDSFRDEPDYQFMTGGNWVAHPGNIIDYTVTVPDTGDPITAGIGDFPYRSEQYYLHCDPSNQVLATTRFTGEHCAWAQGVEMPVVWKRQHGQGRVFYSSLGHTSDEFDVPEMAMLFRRGAQWAAR